MVIHCQTRRVISARNRKASIEQSYAFPFIFVVSTSNTFIIPLCTEATDYIEDSAWPSLLSSGQNAYGNYSLGRVPSHLTFLNRHVSHARAIFCRFLGLSGLISVLCSPVDGLSSIAEACFQLRDVAFRSSISSFYKVRPRCQQQLLGDGGRIDYVSSKLYCKTVFAWQS